MIKQITLTIGLLLIALGIIGLFNDPIFGLFEVDTTQTIAYLVSGIVAYIAVLNGESFSRLYLIIFGISSAIIAILGFAMNGDILGIIGTNRADDYLHATIALAALAVGFGEKK